MRPNLAGSLVILVGCGSSDARSGKPSDAAVDGAVAIDARAISCSEVQNNSLILSLLAPDVTIENTRRSRSASAFTW